MNKIIVLQGPPAAGKSTLARQMVSQDKNNVIVSRDLIRESRGDYWIPEQEDYISDIEEFEVRAAIKRKLTPIIDATNLNPKTIEKWKKLSNELKCDIEFIMVYVPFKTALERDNQRTRSVGEKVLRRYYSTYFHDEFVKEIGYDNFVMKEFNGKPNCVVFDIDGTIAHHHGRLPFEWDKLNTDMCDLRIVRLIKQLNILAIKIVFITGRPDSTKNATEEWLRKYLPEINFSLIMRDSKDSRSGDIVKKELWETRVDPQYNTLCIFEDSNKCADMWRELGILTCQVYKNEY